jgi:hypothetical protein
MLPAQLTDLSLSFIYLKDIMEFGAYYNHLLLDPDYLIMAKIKTITSFGMQ